MNLPINKIIQGDALEVLKILPDESVDCMITSPPYWALRDYGVEGQLGLEPTFQEYISKLCGVFDEVKRVLKKEGTCWVNLGDTYGGTGAGQYKKCLLQIPSRFTIAMTERGWILRNTIIWHKKNAMPSSVLDRFSNKYEQVFFFVKNRKYYFDVDSIRIPYELNEKRSNGIGENAEAMGSPRARVGRQYNSKERTKRRVLEEIARKMGHRRPPENEYDRNPKGKNRGDVWSTTSQPYLEAHFAVFPEKLIEPMILSGCPKGGLVLDIFMGAGTTAVVAKKLGRNYLGIELNPEYVKIVEERLRQVPEPMF